MNELAKLREEATERRRFHASISGTGVELIPTTHRDAEAALDRAIEIAEESGAFLQLFHDLGTIAAKERDQARADVLKLRTALIEAQQEHHADVWALVLADTEHYEQYR